MHVPASGERRRRSREGGGSVWLAIVSCMPMLFSFTCLPGAILIIRYILPQSYYFPPRPLAPRWEIKHDESNMQPGRVANSTCISGRAMLEHVQVYRNKSVSNANIAAAAAAKTQNPQKRPSGHSCMMREGNKPPLRAIPRFSRFWCVWSAHHRAALSRNRLHDSMGRVSGG